MKTQIDIIPSTQIIKSWRLDTTIKVSTVIQELVDNSFDWGATKITISYNSESGIVVHDNGRGIEDISRALRFGDSASEHRRLGRFGIALKKGPARLARILKVKTQNEREMISLKVDWLKMERSGQWLLDSYTTESRGATFTEIKMRGIHPQRIRGWKDMGTKLSVVFSPALRDGKEIILDGVSLSAPKAALLENVIDTGGHINGRVFMVRAGLRPEGESGPLGITVNYLHRVITQEWTPSFLARCNLRRFSANVTLVDGKDEDSHWALNNFKDDIDDEHKEDLEAALEPLLSPIIERVKDETHNLQIRTFERNISDAILNSGNDPCIYKGEGIITSQIPQLSNKHGRRNKRRRKMLSEQKSTHVDENGMKVTTPDSHPFLLGFEGLDIRELTRVLEMGSSVKLIINTNHPYGAELQKQFNQGDEGATYSNAFWSIATFSTSQEDYHKKFRFLLNGTTNVFQAANTNVSRWFEFRQGSNP